MGKGLKPLEEEINLYLLYYPDYQNSSIANQAERLKIYLLIVIVFN
jgi:hypothetical protein